MKKYLNPKILPIVVTVLGMVGFLLRLWTMQGGPDPEQGLYPVATLAWTLLWIVTAITGAAIIFLTRPLGEPVKYNQNFPGSLLAAVGSLVAAVIMVLGGVQSFNGQDTVSFITGLLGLIGGLGMGLVAYTRMKGTKPNFFAHGVVCLYLALRTFNECKLWSNEPQLGLFIFTFLSQICAMLAAYQLCAFDVDLGKRRASLFWSLMAVYLCLVALPSTEDLPFTCGLAVWLLTNLCSLQPVKKRRAPKRVEPEVQATLDGSDVSMDELKSWLEEE